MVTVRLLTVVITLLCVFVAARLDEKSLSKIMGLTSTIAKGRLCYNCLSYETPGCWDPKHPSYQNYSIPSVDCFKPGKEFYCIIITAEAAKLVETGQKIGPVRVRTCVPAKEFKKKLVPYSTCKTLSKELAHSQIFSKITVYKPQCHLCRNHLCVEPNLC